MIIINIIIMITIIIIIRSPSYEYLKLLKATQKRKTVETRNCGHTWESKSSNFVYIYIYKFSVVIACKQALWASQSQNECVMYTVTSQVL